MGSSVQVIGIVIVLFLGVLSKYFVGNLTELEIVLALLWCHKKKKFKIVWIFQIKMTIKDTSCYPPTRGTTSERPNSNDYSAESLSKIKDPSPDWLIYNKMRFIPKFHFLILTLFSAFIELFLQGSFLLPLFIPFRQTCSKETLSHLYPSHSLRWKVLMIAI